MNKIHRKVWSSRLGAVVAVSETATARGKSASSCSGALLAGVLLGLCGASGSALALDPGTLPGGGQVTAGQASIASHGNVMDVTQSSARAAINWQNFSIGSAATVNFLQPNTAAVVLNRVAGSEQSVISGALNANGQVFLLNANGVLFTQGARVDVGGLVASTLDLSDADFMAGKTSFGANGGQASVINFGALTAADGGYVALLGQQVVNEGVISARLGTAILAAGDRIRLDFNGNSLVGVNISQGTLNALVENKQAIVADGGLVILTASGLDTVMSTVVNNSGEIQARTVAEKGGRIYLLGGMEHDAIAVGGKLDASAPDGGDGGFIETSAARVDFAGGMQITTAAAAGRTGEWLIDPYDYTIDATAAGNIVTALNTSNVTVATSSNVSGYGSTGPGAGDITVSSAITSASANRLTLTADHAINVNAAINVGSLILNGTGGINLGADLHTLTDMTLNGNVTLTQDVTLSSGTSQNFGYSASVQNFVVPTGVTSLTVNLVGGAGGKGGRDGSTGGDTGASGSLTASFTVTPGETLYLGVGAGGTGGGNNVTNTGGGAGGANALGIANGGTGGNTGNVGSSGGGGGGGAATVLSRSSSPNASSAMLLGGGAGGGGGSGNNTVCPSVCGGQTAANYATGFQGQAGYNSTNNQPLSGGAFTIDGGGSGGGGGGLQGGASNPTVWDTNEWTGRGGNAGQSGAANGFATTSLSSSTVLLANSANGSATISYGGGTIALNGTVDGVHHLTMSSPNGNVVLGGAVGGSSAPTALDVTAALGISLAGSSVTTSGTQTYMGPVTLDAANTVLTTTNSKVTFGGDIAKGTGAGNLNVSTGSGDVALNGRVGASGVPLGAIAIGSTGTTSLGNNVYAASLTKAGGGATNIFAGRVQTSGGQSYGGQVNLGSDVQLASTGTGDITISGAVANDTQHDLSITAAGGDIALLGNLAIGTNARPSPIGNVVLDASGNVRLGTAGSPIQAYASSLSVKGASTDVHANPGSSFNCNGTTAYGLCMTGSTAFDISGTGTFDGPLYGATSLTKSGTGTLALSGNNRYTGSTTVSAGTLAVGGSGSLGGGSYAGNIAVDGHIEFLSSTNQTLTGAISGSGWINSPGTGSLAISQAAGVTVDSHNSPDKGYGLMVAYAIPTGPGGLSSHYGDAPVFGYQLMDAASGGSAVTGASPSGTATFTNAPTASSAPGNYSVTYSGGVSLGNARYTLAAGSPLAWTVVAAPLTITANSLSRTFDGVPFSGGNGVVYAGFVNGEGVMDLGGVLAYGGSSQGATGVGQYVITPGGYASAHYAFQYVAGQLTILGNTTLGNAGSVATQTGIPGMAGNAVTDTGAGIRGFVLPPAGLNDTIAHVTAASSASGDEPGHLVAMSAIQNLARPQATTEGGSPANAGDGTPELRVPVSHNSRLYVVNGGVRLPTGLGQELFVRSPRDESGD